MHFAFLLSDAGNPLSVCLRQIKSKLTCKNETKGGKVISNQPIIFNITYTPWKLKSNATPEERKKFERERPYYEMSDGGNNIYKYMTADRKLNGANSKSEMRDMISYFEKSTGVFNGDGFISQEELKEIQERSKADKILWHGFISLNEEMSRKIDMPEKCMRLVKRTFGEFFRDMGLDPKNMDLICSLHKDKPHHLHIHFWFAEKEPKCKYRKKELEYRHKGKIEKRRQGNIVLRAVKNIKPEIFERKYRHKVNDNRLKRNLAISHRKVGKLIGGFLASFGEESEYLSRDYTDRLQEIEEEMEAERERQEAQEARASRYNYCKE